MVLGEVTLAAACRISNLSGRTGGFCLSDLDLVTAIERYRNTGTREAVQTTGRDGAGGYAGLRVSETAEMLCSVDPAADWRGETQRGKFIPGVVVAESRVDGPLSCL